MILVKKAAIVFIIGKTTINNAFIIFFPFIYLSTCLIL